MVFSFQFLIFVHAVSLISTLPISTSVSVLKTVDFGMQTLLSVVLGISMFNNLGYFWFILWSTAKGMSSNGRSLLMLRSYMCCDFNSAGACTVIIHMPLGCK